jgi:hypothetical protein
LQKLELEIAVELGADFQPVCRSPLLADLPTAAVLLPSVWCCVLVLIADVAAADMLSTYRNRTLHEALTQTKLFSLSFCALHNQKIPPQNHRPTEQESVVRSARTGARISLCAYV